MADPRPPPDPDGPLLHSGDATLVPTVAGASRPVVLNTVEPSPIPFVLPDADATDTPTETTNSNGTINSKAAATIRAPTNQDQQQQQQKPFPWMPALALASFTVIAVAGIVAGAVCGSGGCSGGGKTTPSPTARMTLSPVQSPAAIFSPTEVPKKPMIPLPPVITPIPTPFTEGTVPTPAPFLMVLPVSVTRPQDITNFINSKSYTGMDLSPTGTRPEERAMQWLINDDPLQLNVGGDEVDEFRLLQRYSLLTFWFQGETGTAWSKSTNWLTADECTWHRIFCNEAGAVRRVRLFGLRLQGTLSPDLGLLTDLTWLELSSNKLSGSLPSEIGLWTSLTIISFAFNNLTGSLPSEIGLWTSLTYFTVWTNGLTGPLPSEIGLWTNLTYFDVEDNSLAGTIPETIVNWSLIEVAYFNDNNFTGSMPDGICQYISGVDSVYADCGFECSCCIFCCSDDDFCF